ncbi:MAG: response regulator [Thermodesulfovibrionales bacterium]|nr:response regulator [Thermodesulfovibrionales bacterium]
MNNDQSKNKILIIDDDKYIRDFLTVLLTNEGYICFKAASGKEALERVKEVKPDLIYLDLFLTDMHGLDVCEKLKKNSLTCLTPIVIITASVNYQLKIKCFEAGASDFITKPLNPIEIATKTRNLLYIKKHQELQVKNLILSQTFTLVENAKKEWETAVDCINDIIILIDGNNVILRANKKLAELANLPIPDLIGKNWEEIIKFCGFNHILFNSGEIELYHTKTERHFNFNIYYINNFKNTNQSAATIILQDITGIKKLTKQLEENQKLLERKNQELESAYSELKSAQSQILQQEKMASIGQLAAGIAHEINNPTGFILSNLNTLLKYTERIKNFLSIQDDAIESLHIENPSLSEKLDKVKEARKTSKLDYILADLINLVNESIEGTIRIKNIVKDLKSFSRVDEAEYKLADINSGIESTINIIWNELKYKAIVIKELGDIPPTRCNLAQLNQVFMNLLMNAVQALKEKGEIRIKTWSESDKIYVSISDTGIGIPKEHIDKIFNPFFTTKPVGEGTGLGLSIAYDIVRKHDGNITVKSELGVGSTFTVSIPVMKN